MGSPWNWRRRAGGGTWTGVLTTVVASAALLAAGSAAGPAGARATTPGAIPSVVSPSAMPSLRWDPAGTGSTEDFRAVDAVTRAVVWAGGTHGQVLRTIDAGRHWNDVTPPASSRYYVRDIEATSARHAVVMTVAMHEDDPRGQRVYVTDDGGRSWSASLVNTDPMGFFDCMAFTDDRHGYLVEDPVHGRFRLFTTRDGGHHWRPLDPARMPVAPAGEYGFAAGGTCMSAVGSHVWFGTGGRSPGRVYRSADRGRTWTVRATTVTGGFPGVLAAQFRDARHGFAVGGDLDDIDAATHTAAWTSDGGRTWHGARTQPGGLRTGAVWVPGLAVAVAVGPNGSEVTLDDGHRWRTIDHAEWNTVSCARDRTCYAVGNAGLVARLTASWSAP